MTAARQASAPSYSAVAAKRAGHSAKGQRRELLPVPAVALTVCGLRETAPFYDADSSPTAVITTAFMKASPMLSDVTPGSSATARWTILRA